MDNFLDFGIQVTLAIQSLGSWLIAPMTLISFLGNEKFFMLVAPALYWCVSPALGIRFAVALVINSHISFATKMFFHAPRPYWYSTQVKAYAMENSFGLPSHHAQTAVVVWGVLAQYARRAWFWALTVGVAFLIGFSRIYLGVHFITDVLFGWLLGLLVLWAIIKLENPVVNWARARTTSQQIVAAFAFSLLMLLLSLAARQRGANWVVPQSWVANAALAFPGETIDPFALSDSVSLAGIFAGMLAGLSLARRHASFNVQGTPWQYLGRYIIGLVGVLILWEGLGMIFPRGEYFVSYLLRYVRYALVGLWISWLAPWVFLQLKLASSVQQIRP